MATILWRRDLITGANDVKTTLSSWDVCMTKTWCKWPAIIGIVVGALIVLSVLTCVFRCLCCGVECCCGCLACFNACCPSPRRKQPRDGYREQPAYYSPRPPPQFDQQYQRPAAPVYGSNAPWPREATAKTATFVTTHTSEDVKSTNVNRYNDDALPAMPSWKGATTRRIEDDDPSAVEMDKLSPKEQRQEPTVATKQSIGPDRELDKRFDSNDWHMPINAAPSRKPLVYGEPEQTAQWQDNRYHDSTRDLHDGANHTSHAAAQRSWQDGQMPSASQHEPEYYATGRPYAYDYDTHANSAAYAQPSRDYVTPYATYEGQPYERELSSSRQSQTMRHGDRVPPRHQLYDNNTQPQPPYHHATSAPLAMPDVPVHTQSSYDSRDGQRPWRGV